MNLSEQKATLEQDLKVAEEKVITWQTEVRAIKAKQKKLDRLIKKAEEIMDTTASSGHQESHTTQWVGDNKNANDRI